MIQTTFQLHFSGILEDVLAIDGARAAAIVDTQSGSCVCEKALWERGTIEQAATMSSETLRTMTRLGRMMAETGNPEDMVATFRDQYYIVRPLQGELLGGLFVLLVLGRSLNTDALAFARYKLMHIAFGLSLLADESRDTLPQNRPARCGETAPGYLPETMHYSLYPMAL